VHNLEKTAIERNMEKDPSQWYMRSRRCRLCGEIFRSGGALFRHLAKNPDHEVDLLYRDVRIRGKRVGTITVPTLDDASHFNGKCSCPKGVFSFINLFDTGDVSSVRSFCIETPYGDIFLNNGLDDTPNRAYSGWSSNGNNIYGEPYEMPHTKMKDVRIYFDGNGHGWTDPLDRCDRARHDHGNYYNGYSKYKYLIPVLRITPDTAESGKF
jgi:hypothetical protein